MKPFNIALILLVFTASIFARDDSVILDSDYPCLGLFPPALKTIDVVYEAKVFYTRPKQFYVPKVEDPKNAIFHSYGLDLDLFSFGNKTKLTNTFVKSCSQVTRPLSETPFGGGQQTQLMALGADGSSWLLSVFASGSRVFITPLSQLGNEAEVAKLYWQDQSQGGYYECSSAELAGLIKKN